MSGVLSYVGRISVFVAKEGVISSFRRYVPMRITTLFIINDTLICTHLDKACAETPNSNRSSDSGEETVVNYCSPTATISFTVASNRPLRSGSRCPTTNTSIVP